MKAIDNYIIEKLHLTKDAKRPDKMTHFIVVYSTKDTAFDSGKQIKRFKLFDSYEDAIEYTKDPENKFLYGYCMTEKNYEKIQDILYSGKVKKIDIVRFDWDERLPRFARSNKLIKLHEYEQI